MRRGFSPLVLGVLVAVLMSTFVLRILGATGGDPSIFIGFGEDSTELTNYGVEKLGEVTLRADRGHDGKFFFLQANDPWLANPEENAELMDRPAYRSQRMFYPLLAGGGGVASPSFIAWSLIVLNVLGLAVGTWAVGRIAVSYEASALVGLAFGLNPGLIIELLIDGAGVVAAGLAFAAVLAVRTDRSWVGIGLLAASALTREVMLIVAVGVAVFLWRNQSRRHAVLAAGIPVGMVAAWYWFVRLQLGGESSGSEVLEIGWPFVGLIEAIPEWTGETLSLVSGVAMLLVLIVFVLRSMQFPTPVGYAFWGFVPLAFLLTERVWAGWFDMTRALAPLITAVILVIYVSREAPALREGVQT